MSPAPNDSLIPPPVSVPIPIPAANDVCSRNQPEVNPSIEVQIPNHVSERCVEPLDRKNIRVRGVTE
jgi:hypothetical protein